MRRTVIAWSSAFALFSLALSAPAGAQADPAAAPPPGAALRTAFLQELADVQTKIKALAEAIPEEKYAWRPAAGVRSIGEVFGHIAGGNYYLTKVAGVEPPAGNPDFEKLGKKELLVWLDKSYEHVRASLNAATPEQLETPVEFFGQKTTARGIYLKTYGHLAEHLGQAIAYARSVGIAPPWSAKG